MRKWFKKWFNAARTFAVAGSGLPAILGSLFAFRETGKFNFLFMLLTVIGVVSLHIGANLINDYFDHLSGADAKNMEGAFPFSGGSRFIQNGVIPPRRFLWASIICFSLALAIGIFLFISVGKWVLIFGLIGLASCILYVSPKFSLTNIGLGEVAVGFNLGFLDIMGSYYVQTSSFTLSSFMLSLPIALTTTLILYINEFPDYKGDLLAGKRNAVVRLGRKKATYLLTIILSLIVITTIANVIFGFITPWSLISLLVIPFSLNGAMVASRYYDDIPNFIPAIISVLNVNMFVNLYLIVACFAFKGYWPIFFITLLLVIAFEIRTLLQINSLKPLFLRRSH
jgi:1,4-dihydroxy-2-naphthoate polyprenyltransferase